MNNILSKNLYRSIRNSILGFIRNNRFSIMNIEKTFPIFIPGSSGNYKLISKLTIDNINSTLESLSELVNNEELENKLIQLYTDKLNPKTLRELKKAFIKNGSDKATTHDYYKIYSNILLSKSSPYKIFEIGLGSNNIKVASNMGKKGHPGASLRSFRDVYSKAEIYGADFDKKILFTEDRILTFYVDQTKVSTFEDLSRIIPNDFDLMIDDGLHSLSANLNSIKFFMDKVKIGGYIVIEDIKENNKDVWLIVNRLIMPKFTSAIYKTKSAYVFIARRRE
jgi:hypothetical protein